MNVLRIRDENAQGLWYSMALKLDSLVRFRLENVPKVVLDP